MPSFNFSLNRRGQKYSLSQGQEVINENDRTHWSTRSAVIRHLRKLAKQAGQNYITAQLRNKKPHIPFDENHPCQVIITISSSSKRRKDGPNLYPTAKPLIDGLVDAGLLVDDNDDVIREYTFIPGNQDVKAKKSLNGDRIERYIITITLNPL